MKRAIFKVLPTKGGWLRTSIVPIGDRRGASFGFVDALMFFALVVVVMAIARLLLAH